MDDLRPDSDRVFRTSGVAEIKGGKSVRKGKEAGGGSDRWVEGEEEVRGEGGGGRRGGGGGGEEQVREERQR